MKKQNFFLLACLIITTIDAGIALNFVTDKDFSGGSVRSLDWHTVENATFLAYVGQNSEDRDIRIAKLKNMNFLDSRVEINFADYGIGKANAVSWTTSGPRYLAVGGETNGAGKEIKIYNYKIYQGGDLERRAYENMPQVNCLDWLEFNNTSFLAVGGFDDNQGQEVRIYSYANDTLTLLTSATYFHGQTSAIAWLTYGSDIYLAVGGCETGVSTDANTRVYLFDPNEYTLTLLDSQSYNYDPITSATWLISGINTYLVTTGSDKINNSQIRIYDFDGSTLNLITQQSFDYGATHASDWLLYQGMMFLTVCGDDGAVNNQVRVYAFDGTSLTIVTSLELGNDIPSSVKWQFVNGAPFLAIGTNGCRALKLYSLSIIS